MLNYDLNIIEGIMFKILTFVDIYFVSIIILLKLYMNANYEELFFLFFISYNEVRPER